MSVKFTPDEILDAAIVVVAEEGVGVSTSRIARASGVSNGTLFNYFPTKQTLFDAMYLRIKRGLADAIGELDPGSPLRDQARQVWDRWVAWATADPAAWTTGRLLHGANLITESVAGEAYDTLTAPLQVLDRLQQIGAVADLPIEYVGAVVQAQLDVAIELGLDADGSEIAFDVMWNGITRTTDPVGAAVRTTTTTNHTNTPVSTGDTP